MILKYSALFLIGSVFLFASLFVLTRRLGVVQLIWQSSVF